MRTLNIVLAAVCALGASTAGPGNPIDGQRAFDSPEAAVDGLIAACEANSTSDLIAILGPEFAAEAESAGTLEERTNRSAIVDLAKQLRRIEKRSDTERVVLLGYELWPMPMPIVYTRAGWQFDTKAGLTEIVKRRIGRNELTAIDVSRTYVAAQFEYAEADRDGDGVLEFAQKILSSAGARDGLYWAVQGATDGDISPLGPFLAAADAANSAKERQGYMGYRYRIMTGQGRHAPGGRASYLRDGNMTDGFALVAWPVAYGHSGIMTFMVSHAGAVYQKDLGSATEKKALGMSRFDPDPSWIFVK